MGEWQNVTSGSPTGTQLQRQAQATEFYNIADPPIQQTPVHQGNNFAQPPILLVAQTPPADPTAPDSSADSPIHRSGQDEENQKLSAADHVRNVSMSPGVLAGRIGTAAGSFAEGDGIVARSERRKLPAVVRSPILLSELPPLSFPDGFRESIGIAVQEPASKRVKAGEVAVKLTMPPHTPSQQVRITESRPQQFRMHSTAAAPPEAAPPEAMQQISSRRIQSCQRRRKHQKCKSHHTNGTKMGTFGGLRR